VVQNGLGGATRGKLNLKVTRGMFHEEVVGLMGPMIQILAAIHELEECSGIKLKLPSQYFIWGSGSVYISKVPVMSVRNTGSPSGDCSTDQLASRERPAGPFGMAERLVVPTKPGNSDGAKGPAQSKADTRSDDGKGEWR
jgi:hypothetical protein